MNRSSRALRGAVVAAVLGSTLLAAATPASATPASVARPAAPAQLTATGPFAADADASLLRVDLPALSPPVLPQTNVDLARSTRGLATSDDRWHSDVGGGLRIGIPRSGLLRLDVARGLRDGRTAFSIGWVR